MSRRFQFSLRSMCVAILAAAAFFGGVRFERDRHNREVLFARANRVDQLMLRFNALMQNERLSDAEALADIAREVQQDAAGRAR